MTRTVRVKNVLIGGGSRISIQSMTNADSMDAEAVKAQISELNDAGCDIVRIAVSSLDELDALGAVVKTSVVPLVADIQFDYRLAVECAKRGFSKIRFNPGNIGSKKNVCEVVKACRDNGVPIRIGVNAGSLEKDILEKYGRSAEALAMSAIRHAEILEELDFRDIVLSVKSSDVTVMTRANRILSEKTDYPLHIGVTESGAYEYGLVKSAIGIGSLLLDGIGDTLRVSLSGDVVQEVRAAKTILRAVGIDKDYCEIISCPTCSRCKYDLMNVLESVRAATQGIDKKMKIAVMGCVVNGPGEAADADLGVAGGKDRSVIFKKGKVIKTVDNDAVIPELLRLIDEIK